MQTVVQIVANYTNTATCSIYLLENNKQHLILRANQGLRSESIGNVRLKWGEGITGQVLKELRPIRESRGSETPNFEYIAGIDKKETPFNKKE